MTEKATHNATLCSRCQKPLGSFKPRVDLDSSETYVKGISKLDPFALNRQEVNKMVLLCDGDLQDYDAELERLQSHILLIKEQRRQLEVHRARLRFITSSLRKIPNEILSLIFDYVCEWNLFQEFPWRFDEEDKPTKLTNPVINYLPALSLSAVCTQWRSVAQSSPHLWSRLKLEISSGNPSTIIPDMLVAFIALIKLFLIRSGCNPLEIDLYIHGEPQYSIHPVLSLIVQQCHRWMSFEYHGQYTISTYLQFDLSGADFALLKSLTFKSGRTATCDLDIFKKSPELERLLLYNLVQSEISWNELYSMDVCATYGQLDIIIDTCPNLTELSLAEVDTTSSHASECTPPRTSETVKSLEIEICSSHARGADLFGMTFSSFTFPALDKLLISADQRHRDRKWPIDSFGAFLSRSSCEITILSVLQVEFSDTDLVSVLQLLPSLVTLEISDLEKTTLMTSYLISSLHGSGHSMLRSTAPAKNSPLIPKLRYLTLHTHCIEFDDNVFIDMVSSRWNLRRRLNADSSSTVGGVDCLRSVVLRFH